MKTTIDEQLTTGTVKTLELTDKIFEKAVLIYPSIGYWDGKVQQTDEDLEIMNASVDKHIYTPGFKYLVPKESVQRFVKYRVGLQNFMRHVSFDFPLRGVRFVPRTNLENTINRLEQMKRDFEVAVEEFCIEYPKLRSIQIKLFNSKYPEKTGELDKHYPDASVIRSKFHFDWTVFRWDVCRIGDIRMQEEAKFREKMNVFLGDCAKELRRAAVASAKTFKESMLNAKAKINERSVQCYRDFLDRFNALNFMGDKKLAEEIEQIKEAFGYVEEWTTEAAEQADIRAHLDAIIKAATDEGETVAIVDGYIREITVDQPVEVEDAQEEVFETNRVLTFVEVDEQDPMAAVLTHS